MAEKLRKEVRHDQSCEFLPFHRIVGGHVRPESCRSGPHGCGGLDARSGQARRHGAAGASWRATCNTLTPMDSSRRKRSTSRQSRRGRRRYESFTLSDLKIRFYGKSAVLTAYCDVKMVGRESFRVRTLQVYTENNGQWQMAAHQSTRLGR